METWQLFIDESGRAGQANEELVVGGWLVRAYDNLALRSRLESALRALPVPYPAHQAHANAPAFHLFAAAHGFGMAVGDPGFRAKALEVCRAWPEWEARGLAGWNGGRLPDLNVFNALAAWLSRQDAVLWQRLEALSRHANRQIGDLLGAVGSIVEAAAVPTGAMVVVATSSAPGVDVAHPAARYLDTLTALLERVAQLLARRQARVWVHASSLELEPGEWFSERHVREAATSARARVPGADKVNLHALPVAGNEQHPGLIVADLVVNRIARRCLRRHHPWAGVASRVGQYVHLPVTVATAWSAAVKLPTLATTGWPQDAVRAALSGATAPPDRPNGPVWGLNQADAWTATVTGTRVGGVA